MKYVVVDKLNTSLIRLHQYNKHPLFLGVLLPGDTASRGAGNMMAYIEKDCLPTHILLPVEQFLVLPTHFEEASYAPEYNFFGSLFLRNRWKN